MVTCSPLSSRCGVAWRTAEPRHAGQDAEPRGDRQRHERGTNRARPGGARRELLPRVARGTAAALADDHARPLRGAWSPSPRWPCCPVAGPHRFWIVAALVARWSSRTTTSTTPACVAPTTSARSSPSATRWWSWPSWPSPPSWSPRSCWSCCPSTPPRRSASGAGSRPRARRSGWLGVAGVLWASGNPGHGWASFLVYALASAFIITVVGGIAAIERDVRGRYVDLMGGIDAVVWEQLTHQPTTLYVNRRAEEIIGYPAESWAQPHFWHEPRPPRRSRVGGRALPPRPSRRATTPRSSTASCAPTAAWCGCRTACGSRWTATATRPACAASWST